MPNGFIALIGVVRTQDSSRYSGGEVNLR